MNKIAEYLQEHLDGDVLTSASARDYFSTDASVLTIKPSLIAYPMNKNDVRKIARFTWQLAESGHILPMTARGRGSDQSGAAIGPGIIVVFPAHMNRLLEMDTKQQAARVQPGISIRSFEETVQTHGLTFPSYPASLDYATIGGAVANNSGGEKSFKYGTTRAWVEQLEVVLANGELIYTKRLSRRELNRKKGLSSMEGELYREIDGIITDNWEVLQQAASERRVTKNSAGYALHNVKHKDGSFDLTPLFVGSQGTLGIITEVIMKLAPYSPKTELIMAGFEGLDQAASAINAIRSLEPSAIEMVDRNLLEFVERVQPNKLKGLLDTTKLPDILLLIEFDDIHERARSKRAKKVMKLLKDLALFSQRSDDYEEQQRLWSIRRAAATVVNYSDGKKAALPIIEDGIVPTAAFADYIEAVTALLKKHHLPVAIWGHAGDANLHMQPIMDLSKLGDRQKVFKLMAEYYKIVLDLGGSIAAEHNDGRLRAPFIPAQYGAELNAAFSALKKACDPHGTLNPGVKIGSEIKDIVPLLRHEYSLNHLADHLPRY